MLDIERRGEGGGDTIGETGAGVFSGRRAENGKFVAAKAREKIGGAQSSLQSRGDGFDQIVAGLMTERVVDILEAIDIDIGGDGAASALLWCGELPKKVSIFSTIWARLGSPDSGSCLAS